MTREPQPLRTLTPHEIAAAAPIPDAQKHVDAIAQAKHRILDGAGTTDDWDLAGSHLAREAHEPDLEAQSELLALSRKRLTADRRLKTIDARITHIRRDAGIDKPISGSIGTLTAFDLPYGEAPAPLVPPFMTRDETTVIYAKGGTGKGLVACWIISELVHKGEVIMVYDAEGHRREWGSRLRAMGLTDDELHRIHYRSPSADEWTAPSGYLSDVHELLRADADALGVTVLVIDSYTYAAAPGADLGGAGPAKEFFDASKRIGRHTLVLAHNTGASGRFPPRPFGSVHVGNGSREMWAVEKVEGEQVEYDRDTNPLQPKIVALELRNTKMSERSDDQPPQFLTFSFFHDGHIEVTRPERTKTTTADLIEEALGTGSMTVKQIVTAIAEDTGEKPSQDTVKKTLQRNPQFTEATNERPRKWTIAR